MAVTAATLVAGDQTTVKLLFQVAPSTTLGEPVELTIRIDNQSETAITADLGLDNRTKFAFRQTKPDQTIVSAQPMPPTNGVAFIRQHDIDRGASWETVLVLDEWFSFEELGRYVIDVDYAGALVSASGQPVPISRTAHLVIEVQPRHVERLRLRCEQWLSAGKSTSQSADKRSEAFTALRYVRDPVAVPYLVGAIEHQEGSAFFDALVKIGGAQAIAALEQLAKSSNSDTSQQARSALLRIRR